jgi:hypothetical protein
MHLKTFTANVKLFKMQREREKYAQKIHAGKSLQCYRQVIRFTVFSNAPVTFKKYTYFKYNPNANI